MLILKGLFVFFENLVYNEIAIYISASVKSYQEGFNRPVFFLFNLILMTEKRHPALDAGSPWITHSYQDFAMQCLSWSIRVLTGVTSRSNLRARLCRRPTENPQARHDEKNVTLHLMLDYAIASKALPLFFIKEIVA